MKRILVLLFIVISTKVVGQPYKPFTSNSKKMFADWSFTNTYSLCFANDALIGNDSIYYTFLNPNGNDIAYTFRFHRWIRGALSDNMPYDQFVRSVLTATGDPEAHPPAKEKLNVRLNPGQFECFGFFFYF